MMSNKEQNIIEENKTLPLGLPNLGNTCYINVILQVLIHIIKTTCTRDFDKYTSHIISKSFDEQQNDCNINNNNNNSNNNPFSQDFQERMRNDVCCILNSLLLRTTSSTTVDKENVLPPTIKDNLYKLNISLNKLHSEFAMGDQHDAAEFFRFFLNQIEMIQTTNNNNMKDDEKKNDNDQEEEGNLGNCSSPLLNNNKSFNNDNNHLRLLYSFFNGKSMTVTRCIECDTKSIANIEPFKDFCLSIHDYDSIQEAFQRSMEPEYLKGKNKYMCNICCSKTEAEYQSQIKTAPDILAFSVRPKTLVDSSNNNNNNNNNIIRRGRGRQDNDFAQYLRSESFLKLDKEITLKKSGDQNDNDNNNNYDYTLFGVVLHSGYSISSGHYTSLFRYENEKWILFDDEKVSKIEENEINCILKTTSHHEKCHQQCIVGVPYMIWYKKNKENNLIN